MPPEEKKADTGTTSAVDVNDYVAVKQELDRERERARNFEGKFVDLEKQLDRFKGVDLDALKAAKEERDILKTQAAGGDETKIAEIVEANTSELRKKWQTEVDELSQKVQALTGENRELQVVDKALEKIGGKFNDDLHVLIKEHLRRDVYLDDDGSFMVKNDKGEIRYSEKDRNKRLSLAEYSEELAARYPSAARAAGVSGAIQPGSRSNGGGSGITAQQFLAMGQAERQQLGLSRDEFRKLSAAAVKLQ